MVWRRICTYEIHKGIRSARVPIQTSFSGKALDNAKLHNASITVQKRRARTVEQPGSSNRHQWENNPLPKTPSFLKMRDRVILCSVFISILHNVPFLCSCVCVCGGGDWLYAYENISRSL